MLKYFYKFGQILVYTTLFIPLLVSDRFIFPFITPRNFIFRLLMSLGAVVLVVLWMNYQELRPKKNWLNIAVISLIGAKFLSSVLGVNFYNSFWSSYERMEGSLAWIFFGIFYFLIITVFRKREEWLWLFRVALIPALWIAFYGFGQALGLDLKYGREQGRIEGTLGNAAYVGAYMAIHIGIALYVVLRDKFLTLRIGAGISAIAFLVALGLAATRGAAVGLILGVLVALIFFILFADKKHNKWRITAGAVILLLAIFTGLILANKESAAVRKIHIIQRLSTISLTDGTTKSRLYIWQMAWNGFKDRPVFGWGQDNFYYIYNKYYDTNAGEEWVDRAHNNLLDQLSMTGLVGFLAYLAVIGFPFYVFYKLRKQDLALATLLFGLWTAYVVQNQFVFDSLNTYIGFFILLGLAEFKKYDFDEAEETNINWDKSEYNTSYNIWIAGGMLVALLIVNGLINYPGYKANKLAILALQRVNAYPEEAFDYFQQSLQLNSFGDKEIVMQLQVNLANFLSNNKLSDKFKTEVLNYSIDKVEQVLEREPDDTRILIFSSYIYHIARILDPSYLDKANEVLIHASEVSPQRSEIYLLLADNAELRGDTVAELEAAQEAYKIDSKVLKIMVRYLVALGKADKITESMKLAEDIVNQYSNNLSHKEMYFVAQAYALNDKWEQVVILGEEIVKLDKTVYQYWNLLATAYEKTGQNNKAAPIRIELDKVEK